MGRRDVESGRTIVGVEWAPCLRRAGSRLALLVLLVLPSGNVSLVAQAHQPHRNTEALRLFEIDEVPADKTLLTETVRDAWYFVSSWSTSQTAVDPGRRAGNSSGRYRFRSPFAVLDKKSGRWWNVAISRLAFEIYPVVPDNVDKSLLWFGVHDARGGIIDWIGDFKATSIADQPLAFSHGPGGLGFIDTTKRTVSYFGQYRDLVGAGVTQLRFEQDAVWAWGRRSGLAQLNGLSRFDRQTRTIEPFPTRSHGYTDWWHVLTLTGTDASISLTVVDRDGWFKRHEFDKTLRQWKQLHFAWVSSVDVPLFAEPAERSQIIEVLHPGMHFGQHAHGHNGHPLVILEERNGWQRVITCTDVIGWSRSGALVDTLEFFRLTLNSPAARRDRGSNVGPRMFLFQAHQYMTDDMQEQISSVLRNSELAADLSKGLLDPQEAVEAQRFLAIEQRRIIDREYVRSLWDDFAKRRQSLLRAKP